jgi:hypothetical protein
MNRGLTIPHRLRRSRNVRLEGDRLGTVNARFGVLAAGVATPGLAGPTALLIRRVHQAETTTGDPCGIGQGCHRATPFPTRSRRHADAGAELGAPAAWTSPNPANSARWQRFPAAVQARSPPSGSVPLWQRADRAYAWSAPTEALTKSPSTRGQPAATRIKNKP